MISRFGEELSISRDEPRALVFQTLANCAAKSSNFFEKVAFSEKQKSTS